TGSPIPTTLHYAATPSRRRRIDPVRLATHQTQKSLDLAPVIQRHPTPFHRSGPLTLADRLLHHLGEPRESHSFGFLVVGQGERGAGAGCNRVKPAKLPGSDSEFPGPSPGRPHESHLLAHPANGEHAGAREAEPISQRSWKVSIGRRGFRGRFRKSVGVACPVCGGSSHVQGSSMAGGSGGVAAAATPSRARKRDTSIPIARSSDASRASSPARKTISRNERITLAGCLVLKKSIAQSARVQSANSVSSNALGAAGAVRRGRLNAKRSPPRASQLSYAMIATAWARLSDGCAGSVEIVTSTSQQSSSSLVRPESSRPATTATGPSTARATSSEAASRGLSRVRFAARSRPVNTAAYMQSAKASGSVSCSVIRATRSAVLCAMP